MAFTDHYSGLTALGNKHRPAPDTFQDGVYVDPVSETRKENRLEHQQDEIDNGTFELRGGGHDHIEVDTSVHTRKKAS